MFRLAAELGLSQIAILVPLGREESAVQSVLLERIQFADHDYPVAPVAFVLFPCLTYLVYHFPAPPLIT